MSFNGFQTPMTGPTGSSPPPPKIKLVKLLDDLKDTSRAPEWKYIGQSPKFLTNSEIGEIYLRPKTSMERITEVFDLKKTFGSIYIDYDSYGGCTSADQGIIFQIKAKGKVKIGLRNPWGTKPDEELSFIWPPNDVNKDAIKNYSDIGININSQASHASYAFPEKSISIPIEDNIRTNILVPFIEGLDPCGVYIDYIFLNYSSNFLRYQ